MTAAHPTLDVLPSAVAKAMAGQTYWFVIGGQAVRCFVPYRPSRDVDFGVLTAKNSTQLLNQLRKSGSVELLERSEGTVHLSFEGIDVSIFVLPDLAPYVQQQHLTVEGLLATKVHAILDRGTRHYNSASKAIVEVSRGAEEWGPSEVAVAWANRAPLTS